MESNATDKPVPREITALLSDERLILRETQRAVTPFGGVAVFISFLGKIGFVKGDGVLTLLANAAGTEISYAGEAQIGGNIASVGQRMVDTAARLLIKRFFKKLAKEGSPDDDDELSESDGAAEEV